MAISSYAKIVPRELGWQRAILERVRRDDESIRLGGSVVGEEPAGGERKVHGGLPGDISSRKQRRKVIVGE
jgi:hypothetical protein